MSTLSAPSAQVAGGQQVTVRVPGSSGNVGPGFDTMGLALGLYDTLTVTTDDSPEAAGAVRIDVAGEGADSVPADETHLVMRVMMKLWEQAGCAAPGVALRAENAIPHGRGLGSSAAAIVSGALAANALLPESARLSDEQVLRLCSDLEGHPDNVAPSLNGGLAISWHAGTGYRTIKVDVLPQVIPVVAIPATALSTDTARALLPHSVSHQSATANSGRTALLVHALTKDPSYLLEGTEDSLHQGYRASAMLPSATLMQGMRAKGFASTISGAGPTVLTLTDGPRQAEAAAAELLEMLESSGTAQDWRVNELKVAGEGAKVEVHQR
ncbi:homoserine kinase [Arthrobacter monumenti]